VKLKGESSARTLVIGDGKESQNKDRYYKNAPLESGEKYRVSIQVENEAGASALYYSQPIEMNDAKKAIAIVIPIVVVLIVAVVVLYYVLRRRQLSAPKDNAKNQELGLANGTAGPGGGHVNPVFTQDRPRIELNSVERKSKVIQLVDFKQVYDELRQDSSYKFAGEFFELKEVGKDQTTEASLLTANRGKNRYTNILAYDKTRVKLGATDDDPGSDYINANFIAGNNSKREFIATQGPLPGTKEDFWRMCWEQNTPIIVALCQVVERGRIKCDHYWPYDSDPEWVGSDLQLVMERESTLPNWTEREFILTKGETSRRIKQYHFTVWPDNGVPSSLEPLVKFVRQVRFEMNRFLDRGPTIIHCSAGVGRTGTFVGYDRLLQDYENKSYVDIFGMVYEMRMSRCLMVQTEAQYICLHELVYDLQIGKYNYDRDNGASDNSGELKTEPQTIGAAQAGITNPALIDTSSSSSGSLTSDEEVILPKAAPILAEPDENSNQANNQLNDAASL